jgi:hypothetical protein
MLLECRLELFRLARSGCTGSGSGRAPARRQRIARRVTVGGGHRFDRLRTIQLLLGGQPTGAGAPPFNGSGRTRRRVWARRLASARPRVCSPGATGRSASGANRERCGYGVTLRSAGPLRFSAGGGCIDDQPVGDELTRSAAKVVWLAVVASAPGRTWRGTATRYLFQPARASGFRIHPSTRWKQISAPTRPCSSRVRPTAHIPVCRQDAARFRVAGPGAPQKSLRRGGRYPPGARTAPDRL